MRLELVVVRVDDLQVLLGDAPRRLVLVHPVYSTSHLFRFGKFFISSSLIIVPVDGLEHVHHLRARLVPHGGARVDLGDGVGGPLLPRVRVARLGVDGDGLVVLRQVVLI